MSQTKLARVLIFVASVTLFIITYLGYQRINQLIAASNQVNQTNLARLQLEHTYGQLREAHSELNNFLITRDTLFYNNFFKTQNEIKASFAKLFSLLKDSPKQCYRLYRIENLMKDRNMFMERNLQTANLSENFENIARVEEYSQRIYTGIEEMQREEILLLQQRENIKSRYESITPLLIFIIALFALGIMLLAYYKINSELNIRTQMQQELELKNIALINTNKELEQFAFGSSHDLQEPLRKIETFCSIIDHKQLLQGQEEGLRLLSKIQSSARRMRSLVNDLLGYSRFYYTDDVYSTVDLNTVVADVLQDYQNVIEETNAHITVDPLPRISGIQPQLYRLFQNLISNGVKYSRLEKDPVIKITTTKIGKGESEGNLQLDPEQEYFKISVSDNGIGFDEEYNDKIFVMFQRLHDRHNYEGTGIGLAICKKVVQNHQGFITAKGSKNNGAVFNVYFPVTIASGVSETVSPKPTPLHKLNSV